MVIKSSYKNHATGHRTTQITNFTNTLRKWLVFVIVAIHIKLATNTMQQVYGTFYDLLNI